MIQGKVNVATTAKYGLENLRELRSATHSIYKRELPKPGSRPPDSATKPCMNSTLHTAPQQFGVCHTHVAGIWS